jgi:hypothetical protein
LGYLTVANDIEPQIPLPFECVAAVVAGPEPPAARWLPVGCNVTRNSRQWHRGNEDAPGVTETLLGGIPPSRLGRVIDAPAGTSAEPGTVWVQWLSFGDDATAADTTTTLAAPQSANDSSNKAQAQPQPPQQQQPGGRRQRRQEPSTQQQEQSPQQLLEAALRKRHIHKYDYGAEGRYEVVRAVHTGDRVVRRNDSWYFGAIDAYGPGTVVGVRYPHGVRSLVVRFDASPDMEYELPQDLTWQSVQFYADGDTLPRCLDSLEKELAPSPQDDEAMQVAPSFDQQQKEDSKMTTSGGGVVSSWAMRLRTEAVTALFSLAGFEQAAMGPVISPTTSALPPIRFPKSFEPPSGDSLFALLNAAAPLLAAETKCTELPTIVSACADLARSMLARQSAGGGKALSFDHALILHLLGFDLGMASADAAGADNFFPALNRVLLARSGPAFEHLKVLVPLIASAVDAAAAAAGGATSDHCYYRGGFLSEAEASPAALAAAFGSDVSSVMLPGVTFWYTAREDAEAAGEAAVAGAASGSAAGRRVLWEVHAPRAAASLSPFSAVAQMGAGVVVLSPNARYQVELAGDAATTPIIRLRLM